MAPSFSRMVAMRYLWSKRREAFITIITIISILGVAIGVMVINIVMAVMTGFEHELKEKIIGANSHVVVRQLRGTIASWEPIGKQLSELPGVESVSPFTYSQALIRSQSSSTGVLIRGIAPETRAADQVSRYLVDPQEIKRLFSPQQLEVTDDSGAPVTAELPGILIGAELARNLGVFPGATISLLAPTVSSTPFGLVPRFRRFLVVGTYSSGLVGYESELAYVGLSAAQQFFQLGEAISGFEVRVGDVDRSPQVAQAIVDALGGLTSGFYAQDWTQSNKALWDAMRLEKKVYFIVLLLIIVMASFSIISTLVMVVIEKRKDIAVLMTLGASRSRIAAIFRIQGTVIGLVGTVFGLLAGYVGCIALREYGFPLDERIFQMSTVPVRLVWENFAMTGLAAFVICVLATIYPARRASGVEPSEVLRYE